MAGIVTLTSPTIQLDSSKSAPFHQHYDTHVLVKSLDFHWMQTILMNVQNALIARIIPIQL